MKKLLLILSFACLLQGQMQSGGTHWVGTWGSAPAPQGDPARKFANETVREIVHVSLGGDTLRIRLSNAFSTEEANIGAVHVALSSADSALAPGTDRAVTFSGQATVRIPPGAVVLSDPIKLAVPTAANLAISLFVPGEATAGGVHGAAHQNTFIAKGDATGSPSLNDAAKVASWFFLTGVDVAAPEGSGAIVALGDSITDGTGSTTDANRRWPDFLAARLHARRTGPRFGIVNMGIGGNRILNDGSISKSPRSGINALARFDEDVLAQSGVKYLVILEGINDIGHIGGKSLPQENVTAEDIIAGHKQMIARAHEAGIKVVGATLTPFNSEPQSSRGYYSPEKEKVRTAVNDWIRNGKAYDAVIDFDKAVRDPQNPNIIAKAFDSGDGLHPGDAGYKAMGDSIDLAIFDDTPLATASPNFVATWAASPSLPLPDDQMRTRKLEFANQTVRLIAHASLGGDAVRIRLSNAFGNAPLRIGAAHIALAGAGSSLAAGSDRALQFGGAPSITIPPGAIVLSDPITLRTPALANLAVSLFLPDSAVASTVHYAAQQTGYVAAGDVTGAATLTEPATINSWPYLVGIDTGAAPGAKTIVAFGDSITDGAKSTVDANRRWPDVLAARLADAKKNTAVVDAGIGGNRILHDAAKNITYGPSALARFDRDVLAQPGVGYVIILEGINDLGHPGGVAPLSETVTAEDMIAGLKQLIDRAHEKGVKVFGATITPSNGSGEKEAKRLAVNEWIRNGKAFDGVVDFEKTVWDPEQHVRFLPAYDSGDHLHPGDVGYKAMGDSIDLGLFR
jgi:lysophospholipase L1-like esterase